jgi:hypothetical protein
MPDNEEEFEDRKPYWMCQECCFRPTWPIDRDFFKKGKEPRKCTRCKSQACTPVGLG